MPLGIPSPKMVAHRPKGARIKRSNNMRLADGLQETQDTTQGDSLYSCPRAMFYIDIAPTLLRHAPCDLSCKNFTTMFEFFGKLLALLEPSVSKAQNATHPLFLMTQESEAEPPLLEAMEENERTLIL